jgi:hypothetical protein
VFLLSIPIETLGTREEKKGGEEKKREEEKREEEKREKGRLSHMMKSGKKR